MAYSLENTQDLTDLADAIRSKTGEQGSLSVADMAEAVEDLEVGGLQVTNIYSTTSNTISYGFKVMLEAFPQLASKIGTITVSTVQASYLADIFVNVSRDNLTVYIIEGGNFHRFLAGNNQLKNVVVTLDSNPYGPSFSRLSQMFSGCGAETINIEGYFTSGVQPSTNNCYMNAMFYSCLNLRTITTLSSLQAYEDNENVQITIRPSASSSFYYGGLEDCISLDEAVGIPVYQVGNPSSASTNVFSGLVDRCYHLKRLTFNVKNGVPYSVNWSNSTLNLQDLGYYSNTVPRNNIRLPIEKEVTDATSYNLLKNDPDWWTYDVNYSRYNHDSAVETINSLPNCSQYGGMTITFKGAAGTYTDGGPISALTAAEIAVATTKGWTVDIR